MSGVGKRIGDLVFVLVIAALLGSSLLFALNQNPDKTLFGCRLYNILSGSMEPTLSVGDLVVVRAVPPEEIQDGDIITYYPTQHTGATVTHRVVGTTLRDGQVVFETRGDAVEQSDPLFYGDAVIGVVIFHIPLLGGVIAWLQSHVPQTLGALALLAAGGWLFARRKGKRERKEGAV